MTKERKVSTAKRERRLNHRKYPNKCEANSMFRQATLHAEKGPDFQRAAKRTESHKRASSQSASSGNRDVGL